MASADLTGAPISAAPTQVRIRPTRRWPGIGIDSLVEYRELIYFLTKRELQIKYKQSVFGVGWVIMQPLAIAFIFSLFLGHVARIGSEGFPYAVFVLVALVPWLFTSQAVGQSANSLVADANLISKVYFPRLALPIARSLGLLLDLAISLIVLLGVMAAYGVAVYEMAFLVPLFLLLGLITAFGAGTLFAAVNVRYRDVALVVPVLINLWLFTSPVIYAGSLVSGPLRYLWAVNPMVSVLTGVRWSLLGATAPDPAMVAISVASALALLTVAIVYFRRTEQFFADVI
jgi:homopolymeric O-antigen transport system permease protein